MNAHLSTILRSALGDDHVKLFEQPVSFEMEQNVARRDQVWAAYTLSERRNAKVFHTR